MPYHFQNNYCWFCVERYNDQLTSPSSNWFGLIEPCTRVSFVYFLLSWSTFFSISFISFSNNHLRSKDHLLSFSSDWFDHDKLQTCFLMLDWFWVLIFFELVGHNLFVLWMFKISIMYYINKVPYNKGKIADQKY